MFTDPPILPTGQAQFPTDVLEVASLNDEDGTVNLWWGDQLIAGVPAATSYRKRKAGDLVTVTKHLGSWRVDAPVGLPDDTITWDEIEGKPAETGSAPPPDTPSPTDRVGYQGGHQTTWNMGRPAQGSYGSNPANTGVWFYGSQVTDAVAGRTVKGIEVKLGRRATGGNPRATPVHLYLVGPGSPPYRTPSLSHRMDVGSLTWNETAWFELDSTAVAALTSGGARALAASAGRGEDYILFSVCGGLRITYQ